MDDAEPQSLDFNARLIAAAPEMYELIEDLYNRLLVLVDPDLADIFTRVGDVLRRIDGEEDYANGSQPC